ncbi:unnamed protein product, partial [Didymodactylos carnosus]
MKIVHKPGKKHNNVDPLSRNPLPVINNITSISLSAEVKQQFVSSYLQDDYFLNIIELIKQDGSPLIKEIKQKIKDYLYQDGLLYYFDSETRSYQLCVPSNSDLKLKILHDSHDAPVAGHFGDYKTSVLIKQSYYWPRMSRDIKKYVFSCQSCQRNKAMNQQSFGQLQSLAIPKGRWEQVTMDFIVGLPKTAAGYDSIIVFIDRLTKRAYFKPTKFQATAVDTVTIFFETIFRHHGLPRVIISDQKWDKTLTQIEFAYNNSIQTSIGFSPFFLDTGRHPRITEQLTYPITPQQDTSQTATDFLNDMQQNLEAAQNSISNALLKQAKYYNKKRQAKQ